MKPFNENSYEQTLIAFFEERLGYDHLYGPDVERDYYVPFYEDRVTQKLHDVNPKVPQAAVDEALRKIAHIETGSLVQCNETFTDWLQNGIDVSYWNGKETKHAHLNLVDYEDIARNSFEIVNQWTFVERSEKRADLIVLLNGLPVVLMELKSPSREETDVSAAYRQIRNYMKEIPQLFHYNMFCVMSDMTETKAGTITANEDRYMQWKSTDGHYLSEEVVDYDIFFEGMFEKHRFLDILRNFICFNKDESGDSKILAGYHQYFAVNKAIERTQPAVNGDGRIGVFWHTQGSGKSLSMVFYAHLLQTAVSQPTIVVVTDRNNLDDQLYGQFSRCKDFLRQQAVQASSRENLKELLEGRKANGIIFTTMQKFEESSEPLSERHNIIVMTDEAHRGQYGFEQKVNIKTGEVNTGTAKVIRDSLPNASFIGFTGTPIALRDKNTVEVFGDIIDTYDMTQSVLDHATVPVYYESRVINLKLDEQTLQALDKEYDALAEEGADELLLEKSKKELSHLDQLLGADATIDSLVKDIINHYEKYRAHELTGKAMIVAYSRPIAIKIYKRILQLRPAWTEKVKVVMTAGNNDPEEWHDIIGNDAYKKKLAKKFKDNDDPMKIAIVVDMWLTGFDVPSLATMYVFKPMSGHNLMQAIARVNRVYKGKVGGLVVDYIGIAQALKEAMKFYTSNDRRRFGDPDIAKTAYVQFREHLEICADLMHGFDYSGFATATDNGRGLLIKEGANFMMAVGMEKKRNDFKKHAQLLHQAYSLCHSLVTEEENWDATFFETIRVMLVRLAGMGKISKKEIDRRIRELLQQSVQSEGVINLFKDEDKEFSLNDPAFMEEVAKMKEKNLAVELLKKIIAEKVRSYKRTNIVQSDKFSDLLSESLKAYLNGMLTNEQVIEELLKLANQIKSAEEQGKELGLSPEEKAFYDALSLPQAVKDAYSNEELVGLTRELTRQLRRSRTIDWQEKESARAKMRLMVKKLLKKYHYPPEEAKNAMETVIKQCELWTDYGDAEEENAQEPTVNVNMDNMQDYSMAAEPSADE